MLLAHRGFANHQLVRWLQNSNWHYCFRLPSDVTLHGAIRHPIELKYLYPAKSEAIVYHDVGLWFDGELRCNIVLANIKGVREPLGSARTNALQSSKKTNCTSALHG
ncbi:MAG: hypothetical protein AAF652_11000 [Cyanobacteria bacterium P01_C01_bin.72]